MLTKDEVSNAVAQKTWMLSMGGGYIHLINGSLVEGLAVGKRRQRAFADHSKVIGWGPSIIRLNRELARLDARSTIGTSH